MRPMWLPNSPRHDNFASYIRGFTQTFVLKVRSVKQVLALHEFHLHDGLKTIIKTN